MLLILIILCIITRHIKSLADGKTYKDCIVVKGQENSGWEMSSVVSEHFENNEAGENIFTYYNKVNNVKSTSVPMGFWCNRYLRLLWLHSQQIRQLS